MTRYLVFERGGEPSGEAVFLRDRFYIVAFLLPFLWLAAHRLYLASAIALVVQVALAFLGGVEGFGMASVALGLLFGTGVALEGPRLVAARLRRRGYGEAAVVYAGGLDDAEMLYFGFDQRPDRTETPAMEGAAPPVRNRADLPALGWRSGRSLLDADPR